MRNPTRASAGLLVFVLLLSCGDARSGGQRVVRDPVLALPGVSAKLPVRWLQRAGRWQRAVACSRSCRFAIPASGRGGASLVAEAIVRPAGSATFRVRLDGVLLDETRVEAVSGRRVDVKLPEEAAGGAALALEVEVGPGVAGPATAFWIDPAFERRLPRIGKPPPGAWNVLLVTSDTTRRDELSCYGGPVATPEIDALAAEGVLFSEVHSVAFGTLPSHTSLMSSRHARGHGVHQNGSKLAPEIPLLAERLREHGFATAAFVSSAVLDRRLGLARGFDLYDGPAGQRRANRTSSLFQDWLDRLDDEPFFAWVHFFDAHQPYDPPPRHAAPYLVGLEDDAVEVDALVASLAKPSRAAGFVVGEAVAAAAPDERGRVDAVARARYRGEIAFVDEQVGRLRRTLEARGLADRTLVVFTADHGENFLGRGPWMAFGHAGLHGDVTRLPLVVRLPDGRFAGRRDASLVSSLDIATTILAAVGVPKPPSWLGRDLLAADSVAPPAHLVLEGSRSNEIAIRSARWLYRESRSQGNARRTRNLGFADGRPFQLYDVERDPHESDDVYDDAHPALDALRAIAAAFQTEGEAPAAELFLEREHVEALEALGYVEDASQP